LLRFIFLPTKFSLCAESNLVLILPSSYKLLEAVIVNAGGKITLIGDMVINYIELNTKNSQIEYQGNAEGRVLIGTTTNSKITIQKATMINISLTTTNDDVTGNLSASNNLDIWTSNGRVNVAGFDPRGSNPSISVRTTNAAVGFEMIATNYSANFDFKTTNGGVNITNLGTAQITRETDRQNYITGKINNGGSQFNLHTSNSRITVELH